MLEHDVHVRRQLARERAERLAGDYRAAQPHPARTPMRDRLTAATATVLARIRSRRRKQAPAYR